MEFNTRGYSLTSLLKYVREGLDPNLRDRTLAKVPPEIIKVCETAKPTEWYPASHTFAFYDALIEACNRDPALVEESLIGVGKFTAQEATNSFLRLLMKVLTPTLFAKKLPSLYERDNTRGKVSVEVEEDRLVLHVEDVKGFQHVGMVSAGWVIFALESMGKKLSERKVSGWSLDDPEVSSVTVEMRWRT